MKAFRWLALAFSLAGGAMVQAQSVPPVDHIFVNDPRVFNLDDNGGGYNLTDGPQASAKIRITQGPRGTLAATAQVQDEFPTMFPTVGLAGRLSIKGTRQLSMRLAGGGAGEPRISIVGTYDAPLQLMRVVVRVRTPSGVRYQWNDSFVPDFAANTGFSIDRTSVATNTQGIIRGQHLFVGPSLMTFSNTADKQLPNFGYQVKGTGVNVIGLYYPGPMNFSVTNARTSLGYGPIFTPGSLVNVTTDNLFTRLF